MLKAEQQARWTLVIGAPGDGVKPEDCWNLIVAIKQIADTEAEDLVFLRQFV